MKWGRGVDRNSRNSVDSHISAQSPNYKTNKKNDISKQLSKQATRQGKLPEVTECLLTRPVFMTPGRYLFYENALKMPQYSINA